MKRAMLFLLLCGFIMCFFSGCAEDVPDPLSVEDLLEMIEGAEPDSVPEPEPVKEEVKSEPQPEPLEPAPEPVPDVPPEPVERQLIDATINIGAGGHAVWSLLLSNGNILHGEIECLNKNVDINVWLLSPWQLKAFKAGDEFFPYWEASRERIVKGSFDFTVPEDGWYYLVIDNKFSWFTSKTVSVNLKVTQ